MAKSHLKLVKPATEKRTVLPRRVPNAELRRREYLTEAEIASPSEAAKDNRYGHRDATMILVAYRHRKLGQHSTISSRLDRLEQQRTQFIAEPEVERRNVGNHRRLRLQRLAELANFAFDIDGYLR